MRKFGVWQILMKVKYGSGRVPTTVYHFTCIGYAILYLRVFIFPVTGR